MYTIEWLLADGEGQTAAGPDRPLDHLVACHDRIEDRLRTMERAAASLETLREEALQALAGCFRFLESNGALHTTDEEDSVFPRLQPKLSDEDWGSVEMLERQHREAESLYVQLKEAAAGLNDASAPVEHIEHFRRILEEFCGLYRSHIAFENHDLIPMARRVLTTPELALISREMKERRGRILSAI